MGLFFNSYNKPGKGIDPDAPPKRSFFRFYDIFFRKFWHFCKAGMLYSAALIPTFIILFMLSLPVSGLLMNAELVASADPTTITLMSIIICLSACNFFVSLWGSGPATAGMTYIMRNYAREEHAWLWSDFKDAFKSNFKQAIAVFVIDLVAVVLFYVAIMVYSHMPAPLSYLKYVIYVIIFIFTMMHLYIYPLMVTFKLKFKDLYRNSLIFAFACLPSNIFIIIVQAIVHIVIPFYIIMSAGQFTIIMLILHFVMEIVLTQAFSLFLVNFNAYPKMKKYILDRIEAENPVTNDKDENNNAGENS